MKDMKKIITILFLLMGCMANINAATKLTAARQQEVIAKINAVSSRIKSMSCSFVQTKHLSLLSDKMVSKGKMYFRNPDKLRWEYTSPYNYIFVFNGTKVYVGSKTKKDVIDTNTNKIFKEIGRIMMNTVTGKALSNQNDFVVNVSSDNTFWIVSLVPQKKEMKQMFARIELLFNKSDTTIAQINLFEKNNDKTNIKLENVVCNGMVADSNFAIP